MFNSISSTYDTLNHRLSFGIDRYWRKRALRHVTQKAKQSAKKDWQEAAKSRPSVLDVATGTGDFAILAAKELGAGSVVGVDIAEGMMSLGREKAMSEGLSHILRFEKQDALHLSFPSSTFDVVIAAFGIRNFEDLDACLKEMQRVMKPGGSLCVVELTEPLRFPMKQLFKVYSHVFLPFYGRLLSKDKCAYNYLTATIEAFPQGEAMRGILTKAGFRDADFERMTCGIATCYFATK